MHEHDNIVENPVAILDIHSQRPSSRMRSLDRAVESVGGLFFFGSILSAWGRTFRPKRAPGVCEL